MRLLTTLYVTDHRSRLSSDHNALMVSAAGGRSRVPLDALESVVVVGHAQITSEALAACARRQIRVCSLQANGKLRYSVNTGGNGNVLLRLAQYRRADAPASAAALAKWFVAGKLQNSRALLRRWASDARSGHVRRRLLRLETGVADNLASLAGADTGDRIRGFEGEGARLYFQGLRHHLLDSRCALNFEARSRRPPRDPVNALLGFVYALFLSEVTGAVESVGLDPQLGFLHGVRPGRPSLALDIMEEFRPAIADRFVVGLLTRGMVAEDGFVTAGLGNACYLGDSARAEVLRAWEAFKTVEVRHPLLQQGLPRGVLPIVQAVLLARHLRGDIPSYPPYIIDE